MNTYCTTKSQTRCKKAGDIRQNLQFFSVSGINWYAAVLNWVATTNVDIYQCTDATYNTSSISPFVSNVSIDVGSTSNMGSYLIKTLNANTTYYYALTLTGSKTALYVLSFTTKTQPTFGGNGSNDTIVISDVNTTYGAPVVNAAYTKMIYSSNNPPGLYYCTSTNGTSWSGKSVISGTTDYKNLSSCLSYKGDIGLFINTNGEVFSINWINAVPSATKIQTISSITMISMNMEGTFAIITLSTNKMFFSRYDVSTQKFNTFAELTQQTMPVIYWSGCFNPSSSLFFCASRATRHNIDVFSVTNISTTPTFTLLRRYTYSFNVSERGLILFGGYDQSLSKYNTTQMYIFQHNGSSQTVRKCDLNENNLPPNESTLTFSPCLSSFKPSSADGNILTISATGYGNYLYYNTSLNEENENSSIKRVQMF